MDYTGKSKKRPGRLECENDLNLECLNMVYCQELEVNLDDDSDDDEDNGPPGLMPCDRWCLAGDGLLARGRDDK